MKKIPDLMWPWAVILMCIVSLSYSFSTIPDIEGNKGFFDGAWMALGQGDMLAGAAFFFTAVLLLWWFFTLIRPKK